MIRPSHPYIIDVEASGLGPDSYPIEVGLALEPNQRYCSLIRPASHWNHWDRQAETVHGIPWGNLLKSGRPLREVASELNQLLRNKVVFSDAWTIDNNWIIELYAAAGVKKRFRVSALETILTERQMDLWRETRDAVVRDLSLERHRASNDSWIIQETYVRTLAMTSRTDCRDGTP